MLLNESSVGRNFALLLSRHCSKETQAYNGLVKWIVIAGSILVVGIAFILGGQYRFSPPSFADLGRVSTPDQCSAFSERLVHDQSQTGFNVSGRYVLGSDARCYVELTLSVANGRLWRLVIDTGAIGLDIIENGASGLDIARCTVDSREQIPTHSSPCIDPLDMSITYGGYESVRDKVFQQ